MLATTVHCEIANKSQSIECSEPQIADALMWQHWTSTDAFVGVAAAASHYILVNGLSSITSD